MKLKGNLSVDKRFWQLHALADEGNECAKSDLFHEYEFIYGVHKAPNLETRDE